MKKLLFIIVILSITITYFGGCKKTSSTDVGGDQSTMGSVGNNFTVTSSNGISDLSAKVVELVDGVSTISVTGKITDESILQLAKMIPKFEFGSFDETTGNFTGNLKMKFTTEGIVDYLNVAERPFVIARFDASVGDTYTCEKANGGTFTRTVTARSDEDEFPYGYYYIKTMTVEEAGRNTAIKKIVYKLNHKFGLVHATVVLQDGSEVSSYLYSVAENK